jgi:thiosulfate/3-mercaptopyruvate sulfurtransferase
MQIPALAARWLLLAVAGCVTIGARVRADQPVPMVVPVSWLAEHLGKEPIVVLHVSDRPTYDAGHIPGAQFVDRADISDPDAALHLQMPSVERLRAAFERLGVGDNTRIVLCLANEWVSPTARVFVALDYLGLGDRTSLLDGGLHRWTAEGHAVTKEVAAPTPGKLTPHPRPEVIVDADWVRARLHQPGITIVDTRLPEFYSGDKSGMGQRPGHIAGAVSLPFTLLNEDSMKLKDRQTLQRLFDEAGVKPGSEVVTYCHIGQQASHVYFVARFLGYRVHLYDGSYEEWGANAALPIEKH